MPPPAPRDAPTPKGEPPWRSEEVGLGSEMGEKVDFHLLPPEDEETSLFTLLGPDLRPCEPLSRSLIGPSRSKEMVAIFLSIREELELSGAKFSPSSSELGVEEYRPVLLSSKGRSRLSTGG